VLHCNGALGQFRDRTDLMLQAIVYLRRKELPQGLPDGVHP
jgi:hypothetical protein